MFWLIVAAIAYCALCALVYAVLAWLFGPPRTLLRGLVIAGAVMPPALTIAVAFSVASIIAPAGAHQPPGSGPYWFIALFGFAVCCIAMICWCASEEVESTTQPSNGNTEAYTGDPTPTTVAANALPEKPSPGRDYMGNWLPHVNGRHQ